MMNKDLFAQYVRGQARTEQDQERRVVYQDVRQYFVVCNGGKSDLKRLLAARIAQFTRKASKARQANNEQESENYLTRVQTYVYLRDVLDGKVSVQLVAPEEQASSLWDEQALQQTER